MLRILPLAAALLLGAASARAQAPVDTLLARGDAAYEALDNPGALQHYRDALAQAPHDAAVQQRLARTYIDHAGDLQAEGDKGAAEATYLRAVDVAETMVEDHPDRPASHFYLAAAKGKLAQFKGGRDKVRIGRDVEQLSQRALAIDPDYAPALVSLGVFYRELADLSWVERTAANALFGGLPDGDLDDSVAALEHAVEADPSFIVARLELARTYDALDRRADALPHLEHALTLTPHGTAERRHQHDARALLDDWR